MNSSNSILSIATDLNYLQVDSRTFKTNYSNLWNISFSGLKLPQTYSLNFLSSFSCLGSLDVSFTNIDITNLQKQVRNIQLLNLSCLNISQLLNHPDSNLFLVYAFPNSWCINGMFVHFIERSRAKEYFTNEKGKFSSLIRSGLYFKDVLIQQKQIDLLQLRKQPLKRTVSELESCNYSKLILNKMPVSFKFGNEQSLWRLNRLSMDLNYRLKMDGVDVDVYDIITNRHDFSAIMVLMLSIWISLFEFPFELLVSLVQSYFPDSKIKECLKWSFKYRIPFLNLVVAKYEMDLYSGFGADSNSFEKKEKVTETIVKTIKAGIVKYYMNQYQYKQQEEGVVGIDVYSLPNKVFEINDINKNGAKETYNLVQTFLEMIQLVSLIPDDELFMRNFTEMNQVYKRVVELVYRECRVQDVEFIDLIKEDLNGVALEYKYQACFSCKSVLKKAGEFFLV